MKQIYPLFATGGWRAVNADLFQSDASLAWFLRRHRATLVARGVLIKLAGRWVATEGMRDVVLDLCREDAAESVRRVKAVDQAA